jgi:hypothetical protein
MTDFNWCHGPECHEKHTVDRVRGVKGSKVLRTRKVKVYNNNGYNAWDNYFCSQRCYDDYTKKHIQEVIAIAPRPDAKETPIHDPKKTPCGNGYYNWNDWDITVDETRQS